MIMASLGLLITNAECAAKCICNKRSAGHEEKTGGDGKKEVGALDPSFLDFISHQILRIEI